MRPIRVVALMEAATVTGPAKNLIRFCQMAHSCDAGVIVSIAAFDRHTRCKTSHLCNPFFEAVRAAKIDLDLIEESGPFDRVVLPSISEIVGRRGADIVQSHAVKSHFLVRYAGLHRRLPWLAFHHGYTSENLKVKMYTQLDRWSLRAATRIVAVCSRFAEQLKQTGIPGSLIDVVHNAVEPFETRIEMKTRSVRQRLGIPDKARVLLSIGRLSPEKGHATLLAAAEILMRDRPAPPLCLVLVGDGPERIRLQGSADSAVRSGKVVFAGHHTDVYQFLEIADVFVLPSFSEGSSNVLLEAMSARVPIVASSVGGVPEVVTHELSALLTPPGDPGSLALQIGRILDSPQLARDLTANAAARVRSCFSPQSRCQSLLRIYYELQAQAAEMGRR